MFPLSKKLVALEVVREEEFLPLKARDCAVTEFCCVVEGVQERECGVCVCVCVCERERQRERERLRGRVSVSERAREREY